MSLFSVKTEFLDYVAQFRPGAKIGRQAQVLGFASQHGLAILSGPSQRGFAETHRRSYKGISEGSSFLFFSYCLKVEMMISWDTHAFLIF